MLMEYPLSAPIANFTDLLLDAVCMVDAGGRFVYVSAACVNIFGYTQQEMIGMTMIDLVAPADRARTLAVAQEVMNGQVHTNFENRYVRKNGDIVHIMWSARWSEADQLRVAVARDVTALKQAQAMQSVLYAIQRRPTQAMTWQTFSSAATPSCMSSCLPPASGWPCATRLARTSTSPTSWTTAPRATQR
jgi:PAS domain S-box-containing protein